MPREDRSTPSAAPGAGVTDTDSNRLWIAAALAAGVAVRLWQYLGNSSLWIDELALARNILERSASGWWGPPSTSNKSRPPVFSSW